MTSKKLPLIQIIKVDEASASESDTKDDLKTIKTGTSGEEIPLMEEQQKKGDKEKDPKSKPAKSDSEIGSNNTSMPSTSFESGTTFNSSVSFGSSPRLSSSSVAVAAAGATSERTIFDNNKKKSDKESKKLPAATTEVESPFPEKYSIPLPNPEILRGAWSELKQKIRSAINTLKAKHEDIIAPGPLATSTPVSKSSSAATVNPTASPIAYKSRSRISSDTSFSQGFSPQNVSSFKNQNEEEETQAMKSQRVLEYVLKNIKTHERVSGIKVSIEHRFNEIH